MSKYVCVELVNTTCHKWQEYSNSIDMLAITREQADVISLATLVLVFSAWGIRQVLNVILKRRY